MSEQYDVIILGSGPGGYVGAIRCSQLGLKTAIVERENLGGICLNWGCIPTKALLRSAEVLHNMKHAAAYGLAADNIRADLEAVVKLSRGVAKQLNQGVTHLMRKNKITVHMGTGVLKGAGKLEVTGDKGTETLTAKHIIVATGARARDLPFAPADGKRVWTYRHAMVPQELPSKLLVIGSGAIGIEFASFYNDMGSEVTVVELADGLIPGADRDLVRPLEKRLRSRLAAIHLATRVSGVVAEAEALSATFEGANAPQGGHFDRILVAVGRRPNGKLIGAEQAGINVDDRGFIAVDDQMRTNRPHIFAIGDVAGNPMLAHKATHEGRVAAEAAAGHKV
ncbi:MAG: FAD-dependent oxidoreductase, partial [Novosphingobium sp.]